MKSKWVVNLSKRNLSKEETKVLEWGMKFAPAPRNIPTMEIIAQVEDALLRSCDPGEADRTRAAVASAIKQAKPQSRTSKKSNGQQYQTSKRIPA